MHLMFSDAKLVYMATEDKSKESNSTADSALVTESTIKGSKFSEVSQPTTP